MNKRTIPNKECKFFAGSYIKKEKKLALALWAIKSRSLSNRYLLDRRLTYRAGFAFLSVNIERLLKIAGIAFAIYKIF